jgi:hypothetical protein
MPAQIDKLAHVFWGELSLAGVNKEGSIGSRCQLCEFCLNGRTVRVRFGELHGRCQSRG